MPENKTISWRTKLHDTIYESNTTAGKAFDIGLLILIISSIMVVMLDSIESYHEKYGDLFYILEWTFTIVFSIEYILRLLSLRRPLRYVVSFLGLIDLLAIIPGYLSLFFGRRSITSRVTCTKALAYFQDF